MRRLLSLAGAGVAGAVTLTLLNQAGRAADDRAPRLDLLGERMLGRGLRRLGARRPRRHALRRLALVADLIANGVYYGALFAGRPSPGLRGGVGGAIAGLAATLLAPSFGLSARRVDAPRRAALTVAWYTSAGLAAAAAYASLARPRSGVVMQSLPISRSAL